MLRHLLKVSCTATARKLIAPLTRFQFSEIKSSEAPANEASIASSPSDTLLSEKALSQCSTLMRRILTNAAVKDIKVNTQKIKKEEESKEILSESKHDLENFRHMLAGPLLSETELDKFCMKKQCPLLLDVKYDGQRTLISFQRGEDLQMISRNGKESRFKKLLQIIQLQLEKTDIQSIKLDGEIVAIDSHTHAPLPFSSLQQQKRLKSEDTPDEDPNILLVVYIFDVIQKDGNNLLEKPLIDRRQLIPSIEVFRTAESRIIHFPQERAKIFEFFREVLERKYEGLIIKGCKDLYYTNESRSHWKKLKRGFSSNRDARISKIELDLVVMGANRGQGSKNSKNFASYLLGTPFNGKIIPISNVGSGLTEEMIALITQHVTEAGLLAEKVPAEYQLGGVRADAYFKPGLIFQVHAQELTVSPLYKLGRGDYGGLSLRFPVFKGIRNDKGVQQATTGTQILELSKSFNFNLPT